MLSSWSTSLSGISMLCPISVSTTVLEFITIDDDEITLFSSLSNWILGLENGNSAIDLKSSLYMKQLNKNMEKTTTTIDRLLFFCPPCFISVEMRNATTAHNWKYKLKLASLTFFFFLLYYLICYQKYLVKWGFQKDVDLVENCHSHILVFVSNEQLPLLDVWCVMWERLGEREWSQSVIHLFIFIFLDCFRTTPPKKIVQPTH